MSILGRYLIINREKSWVQVVDAYQLLSKKIRTTAICNRSTIINPYFLWDRVSNSIDFLCENSVDIDDKQIES